MRVSNPCVSIYIICAFDQHGPWPIEFLVYQFVEQNDVHNHTQTDTKCDCNSYFNLLCKYQYIHAQCQWHIAWDFGTKKLNTL